MQSWILEFLGFPDFHSFISNFSNPNSPNLYLTSCHKFPNFLKFGALKSNLSESSNCIFSIFIACKIIGFKANSSPLKVRGTPKMVRLGTGPEPISREIRVRNLGIPNIAGSRGKFGPMAPRYWPARVILNMNASKTPFGKCL